MLYDKLQYVVDTICNKYCVLNKVCNVLNM